MSNATTARNPADFLKQILGRVVLVKLNSGLEYSGILVCLDGLMNIVLEDVEEYENNQLLAKYNEILLRGNNVLHVTAKNLKKA